MNHFCQSCFHGAFFLLGFRQVILFHIYNSGIVLLFSLNEVVYYTFLMATRFLLIIYFIVAIDTLLSTRLAYLFIQNVTFISIQRALLSLCFCF